MDEPPSRQIRRHGSTLGPAAAAALSTDTELDAASSFATSDEPGNSIRPETQIVKVSSCSLWSRRARSRRRKTTRNQKALRFLDRSSTRAHTQDRPRRAGAKDTRERDVR
ncbi:hypothetical protein NL676_039134 [Syzygium grande]|nr:hypothetical protein NL676_039134 [Syzygium grande]